MPAFNLLPNELIDSVFENLGHIDDAINFMNCCRRLRAHLAAKKEKVRVMRIVLGNSDAHDMDIKLLGLLRDTGVPRIEHGSTMQSFIDCYNIHVDQLEDDDVLAIVAKRQEIQPLQKVYLNQAIRSQYQMSNFPGARRERNEIVECMFRDAKFGMATQLPRLSSENLSAARDAPTDKFAANRFSDAVVALWVIIEARKLIMDLNAKAEVLEEHDQYDDIMGSFWSCSRQKTLLQTLDVLEVHNFLYGFLIRKVYYRRDDAWSTWSGTCQYNGWNDRYAETTEALDPNWARHLQLLGLCLNPVEAAQIGSVEEELADMTPRSRFPLNQTGRYLQYHEIPPPLRKYGIETISTASILEFCVGKQLLQLEEEQEREEGVTAQFVEGWAHFRRNWATTARGSIFQTLRSSEEFLDLLRCWSWTPDPAPSDEWSDGWSSADESECSDESWAESWGKSLEELLPLVSPRLDSFSLSLSRAALKSWRVRIS